MFVKLWTERARPEFSQKIRDINDVELVAQKVKRFFQLHAKNRHKATVLTPALHSGNLCTQSQARHANFYPT